PLVAGVEDGAEGEIQAVAHADGDKDLFLRIVVDTERLLKVGSNRRSQGRDPSIRRILREAALKRVDGGLADPPGGDEVRFADAERNHIVHAGNDVEEAPDARGRHAGDRPRDPHGVTARRRSSSVSTKVSPSSLYFF